MPNHSAFISELYYLSNTGITEFIEVTLKASEDPADYTLSFHTQFGALYPGSNAPGQVGGLLLLRDPNNAVSQNATDPDYNVYTIITRLTAAAARGGESRAVALSNTETVEVIDAYAIGWSDIALTAGPAAGTTALRTGTSGSNTTIQWDSDRVKTVAAQTQDASNVVCLCKGTYIETPSGPRNIADLRIGDFVHTLDRGAVAIQWIGVSKWRKDQVKYSDRLRSVLVPAGALGPHAPKCDLYVSPQHRLLIQSSDAVCGTSPEVFASAKHLVGHNGIRYSPRNDCIEYYHIWLGKHEIIKSNGAYTESFFPGAMALNALTPSQRSALAKTLSGNYALARPHLRGKRLRDLLALYSHRTKPLIN
jgi:hypothetical protein